MAVESFVVWEASVGPAKMVGPSCRHKAREQDRKKYENKKNFYDNLNVVRKTTKRGAVQ